MTDKLSNRKIPDRKLQKHQYFKGYKTLSSAVKHISPKPSCMNHGFFCLVYLNCDYELEDGGDGEGQWPPVSPAEPEMISWFIRKTLKRSFPQNLCSGELNSMQPSCPRPLHGLQLRPFKL